MATANFNDGIFVQEALQNFVATLTPLNAFSRSYSGETSAKGNAVYVPRVDAVTSTTFAYTDNSGFPYEANGGTINTITVNLNNHFVATVDITDIQAANSSPAIITNFAMQQGKELGKRMLQTVWSVFTTTNFGNALTQVSIANYGRAVLTNAKTQMIKRNVSRDRLSLLCDEDVHDSILNDANFFQSYTSNMDILRTGRVPEVLGMPVYDSNIFPTNSISLVGALIHPDAVAVAVRALQPQDPSAYAAVEVVTDAESGISMTYRRHFNPGRGRHYASFECLFGFAVGLSLGAGLLRRSD